MSTPSMLLLCAGAAASLAGVWTLAGLSESTPLRVTPRVALAALVGLVAEVWLYLRASAELRSELSLPLLFGSVSVLALAVGAAKIEAALVEKDGALVVRRAAGIIVGSVLGMAAVGAASLDLSANSLTHARLGWGFMFALLASLLLVFAQRGRYVGAGLLALGQRALMLALVGVALLAGARLTVAAPAQTPRPVREAVPEAPVAEAPAAPPVDSVAPSPPTLDAAAPSPAASDSAALVASGAASAAGARQLEVGAITTRGMLEADVRGGVTRRMDRLQACLADPKNAQSGELTLKVAIDAAGSVAFSKPIGGDLVDKPLADCLLRVFYKMGFAAPPSTTSSFEITLRAP
jgi:hypothetical protein